MPKFNVQLLARTVVSKEVEVEADTEELARKQALYEVDSMPTQSVWIVAGAKEYVPVLLELAELDVFDTDEVEQVEEETEG